MSEFYSGLVVVLKEDIDEDGIKKIMDTMNMIKGVVDVKPIEKDKVENRIHKSRIKSEIMWVIEEAVKKL
jgi:hypothetical protein